MASSGTIEQSGVPLSRGANRVCVFRYRPGDATPYEILPNVQVESIQLAAGADPGLAILRYVLDPLGNPDDPISFEQILSVDGGPSGVVANDERLVILTVDPDGNPCVLFDGFAQVPELVLGPVQESVTFVVQGVAVREWDQPVGGALMRDANDPINGEDVETDLVTHFNPKGEPNATPDGADASDPSGNRYSTFLDPAVIRDPDPRRPWTLSMAARYLCYRQNGTQTYVSNPDSDTLDAMLQVRVSSNGATLNSSDTQTYRNQSIFVPDVPVTGKPWPIALRDILEPHGFGLIFRTETSGDGTPCTSLEVIRTNDDSEASVKDLALQPRGGLFDPGLTNLAKARLSRDTSNVANSYTVESGLVRYEASFILAPGFALDPADANSDASLSQFDLGVGNPLKYRLFVFDETGEGHWNWATSAIVKTVPSLSALFGRATGSSKGYVSRRRPPLGDLFTVDAEQRPLRAKLSISTNYSGTQPGLWDGTGTWQTVGGGFELLSDQLGVWINASNPNAWNIGASKVPNAPYPLGMVRGIEDLNGSAFRRFVLRLTCVIEGDRTVSANAPRRPTSPTAYTITRRIDARDRLAKHVKAAKSEFNPGSTAVVVRDDTRAALTEADARRMTTEAGEVSGQVIIPYFTRAYRVGDRIRSIRGRELSLKTNAGAPADEGDSYPMVVGLTWDFQSGQRTILRLSDQRGTGR
ncbi:hypothetical protein EP7_005228 [Isosphaeraceae bacterium EP7]